LASFQAALQDNQRGNVMSEHIGKMIYGCVLGITFFWAIVCLSVQALAHLGPNSVSAAQTGRGQVALEVDDGDELLQFSSAGHVLGFGRDAVTIAGSDHVFRVEFVGGRKVQPLAAESALVRDRAVPFGRVSYRQVWDGVDVVYSASAQGIMESFYNVENTNGIPASDRIRLRYNRPVYLDDNGNLVTAFAGGHMVESAPVAWQEVADGKRFVQVSFVLHGEDEVGFALNECLPDIPVVIDPVLSWNTFLGGVQRDKGLGMVLDGGGNVYVVGQSEASWGSPIRSHQGGMSAFVAKLGNGGALQWHTFLGGAGWDSAQSIALDNSGNIYVAGGSDATWGSPVTPYPGDESAFAAKLNSNGVLQWNTFLGGAGTDFGESIAVSTSGYVYISGTSSATWGFPAQPFSGEEDAFVAKLLNNGTLEWNTFVGGSGSDRGSAITYHGSGTAAVYVAGSSDISWGTDPVQPHSGGNDAFVAVINPLNGALWANTFIGGSGEDYGTGITTDADGNVYMTGMSSSSWGSPVRAYSGLWDSFVAKFSNSDGTLMWHTFLGGSGYDLSIGIVVQNTNIYVTGRSASSWGQPVKQFSGADDVFIARIAGNTGMSQWHTFLGGEDRDFGSGIAVQSNGNIFVSGTSFSSWESPRLPYAGASDTFVAKLVIRNLNVNSSGASGVPISASPSTYGGTTGYSRGAANGSMITLIAPAKQGSALFESWSGCDAVNPATRTCSVMMNADKVVTVNFNYEGGLPGILYLLLNE
jgi:hypothetical protein